VSEDLTENIKVSGFPAQQQSFVQSILYQTTSTSSSDARQLNQTLLCPCSVFRLQRSLGKLQQNDQLVYRHLQITDAAINETPYQLKHMADSNESVDSKEALTHIHADHAYTVTSPTNLRNQNDLLIKVVKEKNVEIGNLRRRELTKTGKLE